MRLNEAIENNRAWTTQRIEDDPMFFKRLARGQKPSILYIGCSDSRVTAEEMLGAGPGDLFVHRNIANLIPNNDHISNTVINFAIHDLRVKSIVVCGHYGCGGVHEQCINLLKVAEVQNAYSTEGLVLAGWVFDMATGWIIDLKLDIDTIVDSIRDIYSIAEEV